MVRSLAGGSGIVPLPSSCGTVCAPAATLLTHQGKYQARIAGAAITARAAGLPVDSSPWGAHAVTADFHAVPQMFFCDPPAGAVGLTADQAERAGHRIRVVDVDPGESVIGASLFADGYSGRARMVVDEDRGCLLGVTFRRPGRGGTDPFGNRCRGRAGSHLPAVARRAVFPLDQRNLAPPA